MASVEYPVNAGVYRWRMRNEQHRDLAATSIFNHGYGVQTLLVCLSPYMQQLLFAELGRGAEWGRIGTTDANYAKPALDEASMSVQVDAEMVEETVDLGAVEVAELRQNVVVDAHDFIENLLRLPQGPKIGEIAGEEDEVGLMDVRDFPACTRCHMDITECNDVHVSAVFPYHEVSDGSLS